MCHTCWKPTWRAYHALVLLAAKALTAMHKMETFTADERTPTVHESAVNVFSTKKEKKRKEQEFLLVKRIMFALYDQAQLCICIDYILYCIMVLMMLWPHLIPHFAHIAGISLPLWLSQHRVLARQLPVWGEFNFVQTLKAYIGLFLWFIKTHEPQLMSDSAYIILLFHLFPVYLCLFPGVWMSF